MLGRYLCAAGIGCAVLHRHPLESRHCPVARAEKVATRPSDVSPGRRFDVFPSHAVNMSAASTEWKS